MYVIGLTGPMGAGKSVVLEAFREQGAGCLRADDASRELLSPDSRLVHSIAEALGPEVIRADGSLDRERTAALIFVNAESRERLEALVHPPMVRRLRRRLDELRRCDPPPEITVLEAAILTHMGARPLVDSVVRVHAPREECIRRVMLRDGLAQQEAAGRFSVHERLGLLTEPADHVFDASGNLEDTLRRARHLWDVLVREARARSEAS